MIDKSCIAKICKDFDLPFTANEQNFFSTLEDYRDSISNGNEEWEKIAYAKQMVEMMTELEPKLKEKGFGVDILFKLINDFAHFMWHSIIGDYDEAHRYLYNNFNNKDINKEYPIEKLNIPTGDVYSMANINKCYISVDMSKAAFQALHYDSPMLLENQKNWHDYVDYMLESFIITVKEHPEAVMQSVPNNIAKVFEIAQVECFILSYVIHSRQLRQVVFGKTNGSRLCHIEKHIMQKYVYHDIVDKYPDAKVVKFCNDEVIFEYTPELFYFIKENLVPFIDFKVEAFQVGGMKIIQQYTNYGDGSKNIYGNTIPELVKLGVQEYSTNEYNGIMIRTRIDGSESFCLKCCPSNLRYFANCFISGAQNISAVSVNPAFTRIEVNGFITQLIGNFTCEMF